MKAKKWKKSDIGDLSQKLIIVTGGNSGLGFESAKVFAGKGAEVIIACRSLQKGEDARNSILKELTEAKIKVMELDLTDVESIKRFCNEFKSKYSKLDILLNNAGIMMSPYKQSKEGYEYQMATNHLGHFSLTSCLIDTLKNTPGSRVVSVSSLAHKRGDMNFEDLFYQKQINYSTFNSYSRSKLANLFFTYELQRYFEAKNIDCIAVAAHPGVSMTDLGRHIDKKLLFKFIGPLLKILVTKPENGALSQIRASVDTDVKGGEYYGPKGFGEMSGRPGIVKSNKLSNDIEVAKRLWEESVKATGANY